MVSGELRFLKLFELEIDSLFLIDSKGSTVELNTSSNWEPTNAVTATPTTMNHWEVSLWTSTELEVMRNIQLLKHCFSNEVERH